MGKRGPKPKPTRLKILRGNPGNRPLNQNEPQPALGAPECPAWLDKEAKEEWDWVVPQLQPLGYLSVIDRAALAVYCQAWAELRIATKTLQKEGRTFTTETGYMAPHPAVSQQRSAWQAVKSFASLFGLDPSSRQGLKVSLDAGREPTGFEEFLSRRGSS